MRKDRKKEHNKVVRFMRRVNKQVSLDDYVGINRFRIDMLSEKAYRFSDGSGYELDIVFKISDYLTGNYGCFIADNFNYYRKIHEYMNDFMIRCSSGSPGHYPPLHYVAYDVHEIISYRKDMKNIELKTEAIDKYSWLEFKVD